MSRYECIKNIIAVIKHIMIRENNLRIDRPIESISMILP